jgi:hypothetical protein
VALVICDSCRHTKQVAQQRLILLRSIVKRFEMFSRDDQHVRRRLRIDVADYDATLILMYEIRRYRSGDYLTKQTGLL